VKIENFKEKKNHGRILGWPKKQLTKLLADSKNMLILYVWWLLSTA
jgi:hypothetical protein